MFVPMMVPMRPMPYGQHMYGPVDRGMGPDPSMGMHGGARQRHLYSSRPLPNQPASKRLEIKDPSTGGRASAKENAAPAGVAKVPVKASSKSSSSTGSSSGSKQQASSAAAGGAGTEQASGAVGGRKRGKKGVRVNSSVSSSSSSSGASGLGTPHTAAAGAGASAGPAPGCNKMPHGPPAVLAH